jgi:hypothetical protein
VTVGQSETSHGLSTVYRSIKKRFITSDSLNLMVVYSTYIRMYSKQLCMLTMVRVEIPGLWGEVLVYDIANQWQQM